MDVREVIGNYGTVGEIVTALDNVGELLMLLAVGMTDMLLVFFSYPRLLLLLPVVLPEIASTSAS